MSAVERGPKISTENFYIDHFLVLIQDIKLSKESRRTSENYDEILHRVEIENVYERGMISEDDISRSHFWLLVLESLRPKTEIFQIYEPKSEAEK